MVSHMEAKQVNLLEIVVAKARKWKGQTGDDRMLDRWAGCIWKGEITSNMHRTSGNCVFQNSYERIVSVSNTKKWHVLEVITIPVTPIQSLHIRYLYWKTLSGSHKFVLCQLKLFKLRRKLLIINKQNCKTTYYWLNALGFITSVCPTDYLMIRQIGQIYLPGIKKEHLIYLKHSNISIIPSISRSTEKNSFLKHCCQQHESEKFWKEVRKWRLRLIGRGLFQVGKDILSSLNKTVEHSVH